MYFRWLERVRGNLWRIYNLLGILVGTFHSLVNGEEGIRVGGRGKERERDRQTDRKKERQRRRCRERERKN